MSKKLTSILGLLVVTSIVCIGCESTHNVTLEARNKQLIHRMNEEVWNKGNLDLLDELFATDFVRHFLPNGSDTQGLEELREHIRNHREAFPDWTEKIKLIVAEGDLVVIHFASAGTNVGSFLGNPPTGNRVDINEVSVFRIVDGKIVEQWLLPDLWSMNRQLGFTDQTGKNRPGLKK